MNDLSVIDRFTNVFWQYIDSSFGLLGGEIVDIRGKCGSSEVIGSMPASEFELGLHSQRFAWTIACRYVR